MKRVPYLSLFRAICFAVLVVVSTEASRAMEGPLKGLETVPVQEGGRKKPFSTMASEAMQTIAGRANPEIAGEKWDHSKAILSMAFQPDAWQTRPVVLVAYRPLVEKLGLDVSEKCFSVADLATNPQLTAILREARQKKARNKDAKLDPFEQEAQLVVSRLEKLDEVCSGRILRLIPNPTSPTGEWGTPEQAASMYADQRGQTLVAAWAELRNQFVADDLSKLSAASAQVGKLYREAYITTREQIYAADKAAFEAAAAKHGDDKRLEKWKPPEGLPSLSLIDREYFYYSLHPFRLAWIFYAIAGLTLMVTSLVGRRTGYSIAWAAALGGLALQVYGFFCRVTISGHAPVTNMYESIIWVAFGCVLFALVFEAIYRCRYFLLGATPLAVISLILADSHPTVLSSAIKPLVPVLRDNFWLTTHVLCITLSYAAFLLALGVSHLILGKILIFGSKPSAALYNYLYRALQIGVLLLATGTILGAVWANYSWGRFWDWDPKETWALIALLGYLVVLHGRIAGWWGGFGLALGATLGFMLIIMAWYGVNFVLGVGLHSYGFGSGGFPIALGFVGVELAFAAAASYRYRQMRGTGLSARDRELTPDGPLDPAIGHGDSEP